MGKIRRKFEVAFKRQLVLQIESGEISASKACREYQLSYGLIQQWREKFLAGSLTNKPTKEEKALEKELSWYKTKVAELTRDIELLKKVGDYARRLRKESTSIVTGRNLEQYKGGAKCSN